MHWSHENNVGRKFVYMNCFDLVAGSQGADDKQIYDHYNGGYNKCDAFNKQMHGKTWPWRHGGGSRMGMEPNAFDYTFTSILLNSTNAYSNLPENQQSDKTWKNIINVLADGLVKRFRM